MLQFTYIMIYHLRLKKIFLYFMKGYLSLVLWRLREWVKKHNTGSIYRVPGTREKQFNELYENVLKKVQTEEKEVVIGMDQNMDFLKVYKHNSTMELLDINLANDMLPVITKPTRITQSSAMLIDNIYLSKGINTEYFSSILISDISDHLLCYVSLKLNKRKKKDMFEFKARNLNDSKILQVKQVLNGCDWQQLYNGSIDNAFGVYQKI